MRVKEAVQRTATNNVTGTKAVQRGRTKHEGVS